MTKKESVRKTSASDSLPEDISSENETANSLPGNMGDKISFLSNAYATLSIFFSEENNQVILPFTQLDIYNDVDDREIVLSKLIRYDNSLFLSLDILRDLYKGAARLNILSKSGFIIEKESLENCLSFLGEMELLTKEIMRKLEGINKMKPKPEK